jgi:Uri superfamily endonuclease
MPLTSRPGTYALVLACRKTGSLRVGTVGVMPLQQGFYLYVGSAFGPGGLASRIQHHRQIAANPHWHIDYLRAVCAVVEVWFTTNSARREHSWAKAAAGLPGARVPTPGFGSSDCNCRTHLFGFERMPSARTFGQRLKAPIVRIT